MRSLLNLAVRNALRNRRRTALTAATVTAGVAFCVILLSFLGGMFDGMITEWTHAFGPVRVVHADYAAQEQLRPLPQARSRHQCRSAQYLVKVASVHCPAPVEFVTGSIRLYSPVHLIS